MSAPSKFIWVVQNMGGEGKTTIAESLVCVAQMSGESVKVIDLDSGGYGYTRRNGREAAIPIDWQLDALRLPGGGQMSIPQWIEQHAADVDTIICDTGANFLASGSPASGFIDELMTYIKANGGEAIAVAVTAPNKAGCGTLVEQLYNRLNSFGKILVVENDRDGSGAFERLMLPSSDVIRFKHIDPGIQQFRLLHRVPIIELLTNPPQGYTIATAIIAERVKAFAEAPAIRSVFGAAGLQPLEHAAALASITVGYPIFNLVLATDEAIRANSALFYSQIKLLSYEGDDDRHLAQLARSYQDAFTTTRSIRYGEA